MFLHIAESQENPTGMGKPVVAPTVCNASSAANAQRLRRLASVLGEMAAGGNHRRATTRSNRMVVRSGGRVLFVKASEVDWVEAASDYVTLHVGKKSLLLRETITEMERKLGSDGFTRIHRSTIVNLEQIVEMRALDNGEYRVLLRDATELKLSRNYRHALGRLVGTPDGRFPFSGRLAIS